MAGRASARGLIDPNNTGSGVKADTTYRSAENERFLAGLGKLSRIQWRKPTGWRMPKRAARAHVEHPFAHQKGPMRLVIRTIGIARAARP